MEKDELKELDLTLVDIANEGMSKELYDSIVKNSIQDEQGSKRQACHGEKYVSKYLSKEIIIAATKIIIGSAVFGGILVANQRFEIVHEYDRITNAIVNDNLSTAEAKEFKQENNMTDSEKIKAVSLSKSSLDSNNYDWAGNNIVDGHSIYTIDASELTDKQYDAIVNDVESRVDDFKESMNK